MKWIAYIPVLMLSALATTPAVALTFSDSPSTYDASNFADPDDNVPFPHLSDNGQMEGSGFQDSSGNGFSIRGNSANSGPDAFARAQERFSQ